MNIREFEEKYDQYKTVIYRIAFTYLKNNEECEDAMQEVFLKYLLSAPAFESTEHEKRWLIRVTVNYCKNNLKLFGILAEVRLRKLRSFLQITKRKRFWKKSSICRKSSKSSSICIMWKGISVQRLRRFWA